MDQDDIDLQLAIAAILAHSESIEDKLETKTQEEKLKDKNIREEPGLTSEEQKKVEQTTAIVKKSLAKDKKPKEKVAEKKQPEVKEKPVVAKPVAKKVAIKKAVKKTVQPKATKPPKVQPPPIVAVKPTVVKPKATKPPKVQPPPIVAVKPTVVKKKAVKQPKAKKVVKKSSPEPKKDAAEHARIFSEVFIKLWQEKVLEPQQETKIKTAAEDNTVKSKPQPIVAQVPKEQLKKPSKFLDTEGWGSLIKAGVAGGLLAWGFGKEIGQMLGKIDENISDFKQQQQSTFTKSNTIQRRRMRDLAVKPNLTIEELEKERDFQLKELQRDKEFREQFKRNESWWVPRSLDADTQAVEGLDKQIKKRIESLEKFGQTINQLRRDYEKTLAEKEHRKPRDLGEAPKLKPLDLSKEYTDALKRYKMPAILHDYIIKDGKITPFDNKDNILSIKEEGPFDNLFKLTKKVYDTSLKLPSNNITIEPAPVDLSGLVKHFQQQSTYLKQMVEFTDKNSKILQNIAAKPVGGNTVVTNNSRMGNIAGSIAKGADSRNLYRNSAYSINVPAV